MVNNIKVTVKRKKGEHLDELFNAKTKNRYYFEYAYAKAIEFLNANDYAITARKAKAYRKSIISEIQKNLPEGKEYFEVKPSKFLNLLNETIPELSNEKLDEGFMSNTLMAFKQLTGFVGKKDNELSDSSEMKYLPLSPFDDEFANRKAFLDSGVSILYANAKDIERYAEDIKRYGAEYFVQKKTGGLYDINLYRSRKRADGKQFFSNFGKLLTQDDVSGMSRLAPYIDQKNYPMLRQYVIDMGLNDINKYMSSKGLDMACGILDYFQENGIEYEIKKDNQVGHLVANLTGTNLNVRIMNSKDDEGFIGRVYDDGLIYYFGTLVRKSSNSYYTANDLDLSLEDRINLIRFARGETIQRKDKPTKKVGEIDRSFGKKKDKVFEYNQTIVNGKSFSSNYRIAKELNTNYGTVTMRINNSRTLLGDRKYSKEDAEDYVKKAYESSISNYTKNVNLEEILKLDEASVTYHSNDEIESVQRYYRNMLNEKAPEEILEQFKQDLGEMSGIIDKGEYRINPAFVAKHMTSLDEPAINIISLENMFNLIGREQSKYFVGDDYLNTVIKDHLTPFNKANAIKMKTFDGGNEVSNEFVSTCYQRVVDGLTTMGCEFNEDDILMDDNGLISYKVKRPIKRDARDANGKPNSLIIFT